MVLWFFFVFFFSVQALGGAPFFPFKHHPQPPGDSWGLQSDSGPLPTNTWWTNIAVGNGNNTVDPLPYLVRFHQTLGLQVSKPKGAQYGEKFTHYPFSPSVIIGAKEKLKPHRIQKWDPLSVTVEIPTVDDGMITIPLVRGSPYITVHLSNVTLFMRSAFFLNFVDSKRMSGRIGHVSGEKFKLQFKNGQTWILYSFAGKIDFDCTVKGMRSKSKLNGYVRFVLLTNTRWEWILDQHAHNIPLGSDVSYEVHEDLATIKFNFHSISVNKSTNEGELLMLSLPHHDQSMLRAKLPPIMKGSYSTIRGPMTGRLGNEWSLIENLTKIDWNSRPIKSDQKAIIEKTLQRDAQITPNVELQNVYLYGHQLGRLAQLAFIADDLQSPQLAAKIRKKLQLSIDPWLHGDNGNYFVYEDVYKGVCTMNGLISAEKDFGNGWYNDHHIQYGYFIYAAAAIAKGIPEWIEEGTPIRKKIDTLVADIATPTQDNKFFPFARNKDWFLGLSWSSGLFELPHGKNLQSSAESVNAYYAVYLYGKATNNKVIRDFGRLLLATEIRSAKNYFQIWGKNNIFYGKPFSFHKVVGNLWSTRADFHTSFGNNTEYSHCVQMMPFTPISEQLLAPNWISEEYPVLSRVFQSGDVDPRWRSCVVMSQAVIDQSNSWNEALHINQFDSGNSKANMLYWIATRPSDVARTSTQEYQDGGKGVEQEDEGGEKSGAADETHYHLLQ